MSLSLVVTRRSSVSCNTNKIITIDVLVLGDGLTAMQAPNRPNRQTERRTQRQAQTCVALDIVESRSIEQSFVWHFSSSCFSDGFRNFVSFCYVTFTSFPISFRIGCFWNISEFIPAHDDILLCCAVRTLHTREIFRRKNSFGATGPKC